MKSTTSITCVQLALRCVANAERGEMEQTAAPQMPFETRTFFGDFAESEGVCLHQEVEAGQRRGFRAGLVWTVLLRGFESG